MDFFLLASGCVRRPAKFYVEPLITKITSRHDPIFLLVKCFSSKIDFRDPKNSRPDGVPRRSKRRRLAFLPHVP